MKKSHVLIATFVLFLALGTIAPAQVGRGDSLEQGVDHFYAENYPEAFKSFELAEVENPGNHAAYLWHGLTLTAMGDIGRASSVWLEMPYDVKHKATFRYLQGLAYWRAGETAQAKWWFEALRDYKETPAYPLSQTALKSLLSGEQAPPISEWASLAKLPGAKGVSSSQTGASSLPSEPQPSVSTVASAPGKAVFAGASPGGGQWRGTISNGYKGQTIGFRVSADGKTISDVVFQGYLIRRGGGIEDTQLAPLRNIPVNGGAFEDTQLNGASKVRFDFTGVFTSATTAEGTYRVMSDTDCDTYKLNWTASRVGN